MFRVPINKMFGGAEVIASPPANAAAAASTTIPPVTPSTATPPPAVTPPASSVIPIVLPQNEMLNYMRCTSDDDCVADEAKFSRYCNAAKNKCACFNNADSANLPCDQVPRIVRTVVGPQGPVEESVPIAWQWVAVAFIIVVVLIALVFAIYMFSRNNRSSSF